MKKSLLLVLLTIILVSSLAFAACDLIDPDKGWGTVFTYETAYAEAQELGYTGSLQEFIDSIKGKDGANGKDGVGIKSVTVNDQGKLIVTLTNDTVIDCGSVKGPQGDAGNGIRSIEKTSTNGLVDTYTITFTDGTTTTFTVTNGKDGQDGEQGIQGIQGKPGVDGHTPVITIQGGYWYIDGVNTNVLAEGIKGETGNGISSIEKTSSEGLVDTYTITFTNGTTTTFTVTNGKDGQDGAQGIQGIQGIPGKDGHTPVITIQNGYWYIDGVNTNVLAEGIKGETGNSISSIEKTSSEGLVDTYTITFTDGTTTTFTVTNGKDGEQGIQGIQGIQGKPGTDGHTPVITIQGGYWYIDGINTNVLAEGLKGETGNGISSIEMTSSEGLVDTYTITFTDGTTTTFTVTNGKDGEQGAQGIQGIQGIPGKDGHTPVITIQNGYWYIDDVNTNVLAEGIKGETGNGISSIAKTSSAGLVDIYTITYTNGTTTTFTVTNGKDGEQGIQGIQGEPGKDGHTPVITIQEGYWYIDGVNTNVLAEGLKGETGNGIASIEKTNTEGLVDTYTITYTDGTTTTFTVTNGAQGQQGIQGIPGKDGHTPVITIQNGYWYIDGVNTNVKAEGIQGPQGVGIVSTHFDENGNMVITYSDGTVQIVEHTWEELYTLIQPGCTTEGKALYACVDCSLVRSVTLPATGHTEGEWIVDNEPTCTQEGSKIQLCTTCGDILQIVSVPVVDHNYVDGFVCSECFAINPDFPSKTYNIAATSLPTNWNPHTYQTDAAKHVLDYTTDTLYTYDYNEDGTGFVITPSMASAMPVDVSDLYADQFGYEKGLEGKAYRISLKDNLKYDNGDPITAHSFVESVKRLLDSQANNSRASELYATGDLKILGAEQYVKQGTSTWEDVTAGVGLGKGAFAGWFTAEQLDAGLSIADANVSAEVANSIKFSLENCFVGNWIASTYGSYVSANGMLWTWSTLFAVAEDAITALEGKTLAEIKADPALAAVMDALLAGWCTDVDEPAGFFAQEVVHPEFDFSDVGFFAEDDHNLVIVLIDEMANDFWLKYDLVTNFGLVHTPTYDACASVVDGKYTNNYGTSVDTYVGYGPYKLVSHDADSALQFVKNIHWYDFSNTKIYQATDVVIKQADAEEQLQMFLNGELDHYDLREEDMAQYASSSYTYYVESESTWFVAMNPDEYNLAQMANVATPVTAGNTVIKQPIAIKEFRQALSDSLDRTAFCLALSPTSSAAKGTLSSGIVDPEAGFSYRSTDEAKDTLLKYWGLSDKWGPGKQYATRDEAIASITGYNLEGAKQLFTQAYNIAVQNGWIPSGNNWELQLMIGASNWNSPFFSKGYDFLSSNWVEAVKGTPWEGHLVFVQSDSLGNGWSDALRSGAIDMLFRVSLGDYSDPPYSMLAAFISDSVAYDTFTDKNTVMLDIEINGQTLRASLADWLGKCLRGETIQASVVGVDGELTGEKIAVNAGANADTALRLKVLAACEVACLDLFNMLPLYTDATAFMISQRTAFKTEEHMYGIGYGGLKYLRFTMTDAEWAAYIASQGGVLDYTGNQGGEITPPAHECANVCPTCGKCTNEDCAEASCTEKCEGHTVTPPAHECESVCQTCGGCLDEDCTETVCQTKCDCTQGSIGLEYTLSEDGTYYIVSGIGACTDENIVIPSTYEGKPVTGIGDNVFSGCTGLTTVTISDDTTSASSYALKNCRRQANPTTPRSVTSTGSNAFNMWNSIKSLIIPDSVTNIGEGVFSGCTSLIEVHISSIAAWFKLYFSGDTSNPLYNGAVLYLKGENVRELVIPEGITSIGDFAFYNYDNLISITIPSSVTYIGNWAFHDCNNLTSINVANNNASYQSIDGSLYTKDGKLLIQYAMGKTDTSFDIPSGVTNINFGAFYGCHSLNSVTIPEGVTSIDHSVFWGCHNLTSITLPSSVTSIGESTFWECANITSINVDDNNENYQSIDGNLYTKDGKTLIQYAIGKTDASFVIPDGVTSIGKSAFGSCMSLESITIPSSVTCIGEAAFSWCTSLTSVTIHEGVTRIGANAFNCCMSLETITLPSSVTSIGEWAFNYTAYSDDTNNWQDGVLYIDNCLIAVEETIETCTIKEGTTVIADYVFIYHANLTSITIPSSVTSIGDFAFNSCSSLTSITIPDSVTSIGKSAFGACTGLTSITVPNSVTSIGEHAFSACTNLTSVTFEGNNCWYVSFGEDFPKTYLDLSDAYQNAAYLQSYVDYYWYTDPNGHIEGQWIVDVEPGCTTDGSKHQVCTNCGTTIKTESIGALGHSHDSVVTAPTCTTQGYTTHTCSTCGDSYVDTYVDNLGGNHRWGNLVVTSATCTENGYITITCGNCNKVADSRYDQEAKDYLVDYPYFNLAPKGHTYEEIVTVPTCTEQGYTTHTCATCGDSYVDSYVDSLGHTEANSEGKCERCDVILICYDIPTALVAPTGTPVQLTGTVIGYYNNYKNNIYIVDENNNSILIYKATSEATIGDVITVNGVISVYNGANQVAQGSTITIVTPHECSAFSEATCTVAATCQVCGKTSGEALGHIDENADGNCDRCNKLLESDNPDSNLNTYEEYVAACVANNGSVISIKAYVIGVIALEDAAKGSLFLQDADGNGYYVYRPAGTIDGCATTDELRAKWPIGTEVIVTGAVCTYNGQYEFKANAEVLVTGDTVQSSELAYVDATTNFASATSNADSTLNQYQNRRVTLKGATIKHSSYTLTENGQIKIAYYYFTLPGSDVEFYIYLSETYGYFLSGDTVKALDELLAYCNLEKATVDLTGIIVVYRGVFQLNLDSADSVILVQGGEGTTPPTGGDTTGAKYVLVTDLSTLAAGDKVIIVAAGDKNFGLADQNGAGYRNKVDITKSGNEISAVTGLVELTLGKKGDNWTFADGTGFLGLNTDSNKLFTVNSVDNNDAQWTITIDTDGNATITSVAYPARSMCYNASNPRFACYKASSNQLPISIYKLVEAE